MCDIEINVVVIQETDAKNESQLHSKEKIPDYDLPGASCHSTSAMQRMCEIASEMQNSYQIYACPTIPLKRLSS